MPKSSKDRLKAKIKYLDRQLASLDRYLPDTYEYLVGELDHQRRLLSELEVKEAFDAIETDERPYDSSNNEM